MDDKDLKEQLSDVDGQEPSLHKLDKKMTIIIMQQCENLAILGRHDSRLEKLENDNKNNRGFIKGVVWVFTSIGAVLTTWLAFKK